MANDGLTGTPFEHPTVPTPSGADGTTLDGERGGADWPMADNGKPGLTGVAFEDPIMSPSSGKETSNTSGLHLLSNLTDVKDGPSAGSTVKVEPGVASPAVAAGNIDQK